MTTVYVLNLPRGFYVGITDNLPRRLEQHNSGQSVIAGKKLAAKNNVVLHHNWELPNRYVAAKFEQYLHHLQRKATEVFNDILLDCPFWCKALELEVEKYHLFKTEFYLNRPYVHVNKNQSWQL